MRKFYLGTSGFFYSHWIGGFYPKDIRKDERLSFYCQHFNTVEINSSFYHTPRTTTVSNWIKAVPADFVFSFKMSRFITHVKKIAVEEESLEKFFNGLSPLKLQKRKHLVLIQLPPQLKADKERLINFIGNLPKGFLYAFEFRHPSWLDRQIFQILG